MFAVGTGRMRISSGLSKRVLPATGKRLPRHGGMAFVVRCWRPGIGSIYVENLALPVPILCAGRYDEGDPHWVICYSAHDRLASSGALRAGGKLSQGYGFDGVAKTQMAKN